MPVVLGYHGCAATTAQGLLSGLDFQVSNKLYDWLGEGAYFWEWDPARAYAWARERRPMEPCVVGAAIELGNCLDLTQQSGVAAVRRAHISFERLQSRLKEKPLKNLPGKGSNPGDRVLRFLDRAVIDHLHAFNRKQAKLHPGQAREFDTVRALFPEGDAVYPTSGFQEKTHVQIAVKQIAVIRGVFRLPRAELDRHGLPADLYAGAGWNSPKA